MTKDQLKLELSNQHAKNKMLCDKMLEFKKAAQKNVDEHGAINPLWLYHEAVVTLTKVGML